MRNRERADNKLQPTALVNGADIRLVDLTHFGNGDEDNARAQFVAISTRAMRHILVDHTRERGRHQRDSAKLPATLDEPLTDMPAQGSTLIELEAALKKLESIDPRLVRAAELRIFGGYSIREMAPYMNLSLTRAKVVWASTRAVLGKLLDEL